MTQIKIVVIIPAYNEEQSIGLVLQDIPTGLATEVIVADNGSNDKTAKVACAHGATVLHESEKGYGAACLKAIEYLKSKPLDLQPDIICFLDGDFSDHPEEMNLLVSPIVNRKVDLVIGSRAKGELQRGAMMPQQIFGNWLATTLLKLIYRVNYTDLGPFRAIRWDKFLELGMVDRNFGWTVELQVKAAKQRMSYCEVPVSYRKRVGVSKVTGTLKGSVMAGYKILYTIFKYM